MVYRHRHVNSCDRGVCFMGWILIGRAVTTLSRAAAANAKSFPITMRVIQVGKLHSAAYVLLQQWAYTSLLVCSVLWISYEHEVDWSRRVIAGSDFCAGSSMSCWWTEFFCQYRITLRVDYSCNYVLSLVSVLKKCECNISRRYILGIAFSIIHSNKHRCINIGDFFLLSCVSKVKSYLSQMGKDV